MTFQIRDLNTTPFKPGAVIISFSASKHKSFLCRPLLVHYL